MVAATEKKRGRPAIQLYADALNLNNSFGAYNKELSTRAVQNKVNAEYFFVNVVDDDNAPNELYFFFATSEGGLRHNGIAEQIGRLLRGKHISFNQATDIALQVIEEYKNGATSKQIEQQLRRYKIYLQKEDGQNNQ